jgi:hypothetical protein
MNRIFAVTLAGLLMSSVSLGVAYADGSSSSSNDQNSNNQNSNNQNSNNQNSNDQNSKDNSNKPKLDTFSVSYGDTGVTTASPNGVKILGVETFAGLASGEQTVKTDYGIYTNVSITAVQTGGGNGGEGEDGKNAPPKTFTNFADATAQTPYSLSFSSSSGNGPDYFGFYLPNADAGATLTFLRNGVVVGTLTGSQIDAGFSGGSNNGGGDNQTSYANGHFVSIFDKTGSFDTIKFSDSGEGQGFLTGDHTVGSFDNGVGQLGGGGGLAGGVPEPAAWTMMIVGVGLIGGALRRRRATSLAAGAA